MLISLSRMLLSPLRMLTSPWPMVVALQAIIYPSRLLDTIVGNERRLHEQASIQLALPAAHPDPNPNPEP